MKPVVTEKHEFEYRDESILLALLEFSYDEDSDAGNKNDNFPIEWFAKNSKLSIELLWEQIKPGVMESWKV